MAVALGNLESQLFAYTQMRRLRTIRIGDLLRPLGITSQQERELLSRLARRRMIARVRRGMYLVPPRLPPGGKWSPGEFTALGALMEDRGGRYQVCGPSAFYRYGWSNQIPNRLYVYNNRISGERTIGSVAISLIKLADDRLGETETIETPEGLDAVYSSRIRTLVDAVYDWSRFDSLPRGYDWIRAEIAQNPKSASEIARVALQYGNVSTLRRVGKLLEKVGVDEELLGKLTRKLPATSGFIPWVPTLPKRGVMDRRWGVIVNDEQ
jgi:predicted transcriptional regulator of viral defense system